MPQDKTIDLDYAWAIENDRFVFSDSLYDIKSETGQSISQLVRSVNNGLQVFIRGSQLESARPFASADVDLFVVYDYRSQLVILNRILPSNLNYDIKLMHRDSIFNDFVYHALLQCRSLQLCGPPFHRTDILANKDFAWRHWLKYCPVMLPDKLATSSRSALMQFKLLARSFGVLSFLKYYQFSRDINDCIYFASHENRKVGIKLEDIRRALEQAVCSQFDIRDIKAHLIQHFDLYMNGWVGVSKRHF